MGWPQIGYRLSFQMAEKGTTLAFAAQTSERYGLNVPFRNRADCCRPCRGFARCMRGWLLATLSILSIAASAGAPSITGQPAPDFVLKTLEQGNLRLSEFRGQVVLVNFWASWCGACRQAMPTFNDIHDKYQQAGLVLLSINLDDEAEHAQQMAQSLKIRFPVLLDEQKAVSRLYQMETMPLTVLIDREGVVRFVYVGFNAGDEIKLLTPLRALLNE
jgi:peroxiredoxin